MSNDSEQIVAHGGPKDPATISIDDARANMQEIIQNTTPGEERVIADNERPKPAKPPRPGPGVCKGAIIYMAPDFDAPLEDMIE